MGWCVLSTGKENRILFFESCVAELEEIIRINDVIIDRKKIKKSKPWSFAQGTGEFAGRDVVPFVIATEVLYSNRVDIF